ncbi:MAG: hypothetical protein HYY77_03790 [Betaproteobacteria bacterium]|nr:hypothetical protein [Betaproteobacteria bacterium]
MRRQGTIATLDMGLGFAACACIVHHVDDLAHCDFDQQYVTANQYAHVSGKRAAQPAFKLVRQQILSDSRK